MDKSKIVKILNEQIEISKLEETDINWRILQDIIKKVVLKPNRLKRATKEQKKTIIFMYLAKIDKLNGHNY